MPAPHAPSRRSKAAVNAGSPAALAQPVRRWLLLVHQLPATPSNLRVRTWRRLQQLGAVAFKQSVYALPDSADAREDFEWLKTEVESAGGEATVFAADTLDQVADAELVEEFRRSRQGSYAALAADIQRARRSTTSKRTLRPHRSPRGRDRIEVFRQRFAAIERVDFFGSAGRDRVIALLAELDADTSTASGAARAPARAALAADRFRHRVWITRPRPGVDRMASAWLIRRFVDPDARFGFVTDAKAGPPDSVPFDMFGVDFSHHGADCTFETLRARFDIRDAAVNRLATIVHDLDLKDNKFGAPEAATLGATIDGLQLACPDDTVLLEQGITLFEALYQSFTHAGRPSGPKPVVRPRSRTRRSS